MDKVLTHDIPLLLQKVSAAVYIMNNLRINIFTIGDLRSIKT